MEKDTTSNIATLPNDRLFEEAAKRLRDLGGHGFKFGSFEFIFHDGRFQGIEMRARNKCYRSQTGWARVPVHGPKGESRDE